MIINIIIVFILLLIIFIIIDNIVKYRKEKKDMKDLTGNYCHYKTPEGLLIKVQYKIGNILKFRIATEEELEILRKYKYL